MMNSASKIVSLSEVGLETVRKKYEELLDIVNSENSVMKENIEECKTLELEENQKMNR